MHTYMHTYQRDGGRGAESLELPRGPQQVHLGFGRIVFSEKEVTNMLVIQL